MEMINDNVSQIAHKIIFWVIKYTLHENETDNNP
jgi:hypothetical protein